jgi:HTH-type transcriptional regulator/antitoxin HigA
MPNTARTNGSYDIKTFTKAANSKTVSALLDVLSIRDAASHARAVELVGDLMDITGDNPGHPLYRLIDILADAIEHYEEKIYSPIKTTPAGLLKFLMEQNNLTQTDLGAVLGSQSIVSEILSGKREMNLRHIRKLAERFRVDPAVFV